jgi:hypothetical protein
VSKPTATRGLVRAFCIVPVLAIIAIALLVLAPAGQHSVAGAPSAVAFAPQPTVPPAAQGRIQASYAALPLAFEPNQGQTDAQVKYMARGNGYILFLTADDAVFSLHSPSAARTARKDSTAVLHMQLVGGNSPAKVASSGQLPGRTNYFLGNDPSKWRSNVARYARVSYQDVYPGVNLAFHGAQRQVEFDFMVAAGASPAPIGFHFTGAQGMKTDDSGNLVVTSAAGDVLLHKPVAYQEQNGARQAVDARFVLKAGNQVRFELGNYDHSRELVIDPSVSYAYSTYLGGSGDDEGFGIAFDSTGDAYVTGQTASPTFPGASGTLKDTASVFVTKIAKAGSSLVYSTYVGGTGTGSDSGNAIAVDSSGDAFVAGGTSSTDFPHTSGAFQSALKGTTGNAFVFELGPSGTISYSTYLGGTGTDKALGIALASDGSGEVFAAGYTSSTDFPTLNNGSLQGYLTGSTGSGFVTKLNSLGTGLVYSTYVGGSNVGIGDTATAVAVDSSDNAYVTGQTFSATFHITTGAVQVTCGNCSGGNANAFVTVIKADGTGYVYSTFLGGSNGNDGALGIAVDSAGNAYVTGATTSSNFPKTTGALQTSLGGTGDAFVTKLNPAGSALVYSTFLGGGLLDIGTGIAVDGSNNAYVTGQTDSTTPTPFPTAGATQSTLGGGFDAFVSEINSTGSALVFSTYLGGLQNEDASGQGAIAVDSVGDSIYVTGTTASLSTDAPPFPTHNPLQATNGGGNDAFVVKYAQPAFSMSANIVPSSVAPGGSATSTVTLTSLNGYSSPVTLSCSVSGAGVPLPGCSVTGTNPVTPTSGGVNSTVTITTSAGPFASVAKPTKFYYAMWLPIAGLSLVGMGFSTSSSRRKKLFGFLMIGMVMAAFFLMPACGGGYGGGGGGNACASAPTVPTGLAATGTTGTSTTLNWTASTVGAYCSLTKYTVYQNGTAIGSPTTNTLNVTGLAPSTTYTFTVSATDSYGTSAPSSPPLSVTTGTGTTPAGNYTITITGTDGNGRSQTTKVILNVT